MESGDEAAAAGDFAPDATEERIPFAIFRAIGPIGIVVVRAEEEAFRVGHEAEDAAGFVLEAGDAEGGTIHIVGVLERDEAFGEVFLGFAFRGDEASFGVGDGEFEVWGHFREERIVRGGDFEFDPAALESTAGIIDEGTGGEDADSGEDLEAVADAEDIATRADERFDGIAEAAFRDELGDAACHDVIAVGKAAAEDGELGCLEVVAGDLGDGYDGRGKACGFEGAGGFGVAVGTGEFDEQGRWLVEHGGWWDRSIGGV